jgi:enamine deaminase RidA (YjgF/YER057c/UK114 family)
VRVQQKEALCHAGVEIEQGDVMAKVSFSNPKTLAPPPGYSYVVEASGKVRTVYFAGQLGLDTENKFVGAPGDFRAQCQAAFANMTLALKSAGAAWSDVVKINNFLVDIQANMAAFREVRDTFLNRKAPPASTTIGVPALARPGGLFEIEAIAVIAGKAKNSAKAEKEKEKEKEKKKRR